MNVSGEFTDISNLYRYNLRIIYEGKELILGRSVLISALHKTERRRKSGIRLLFVLAFFDAISKLDSDGIKRVQGSLTFFLNRFAICVFEEGSILHADIDTKKRIVSLLVEARTSSNAQNWTKASESLCEIIRISHHLPRGRFCNIFMALGCISDQLEYEEQEFLKLLDKDILYSIKHSNTVKSKKIVIDRTKKLCPELLPILEQEKYLNCGELRKNMYIVINLITVIHEREITPTNNGDIEIMNTSVKELEEMGVYDLHVKGKAYKHIFKTKGGLISKEVYSPLCVLGYEYEDLEEFYQNI